MTLRRRILFTITVLVYLLLMTFLITPSSNIGKLSLSENKPAPSTIIVRHDFQFEDTQKLEELKRAHVLSIIPRFLQDPTVDVESRRRADELIDEVRALAESDSPGRLQALKSLYGDKVGIEAIDLRKRDFVKVRAAVHRLLDEFILEKGIVKDYKDMDTYKIRRHLKHEVVTIPIGETIPTKKFHGTAGIMDIRTLNRYLRDSINDIFPNTKGRNLVASIVTQTIRPNLVLDIEHYRMEKERALGSVGSIPLHSYERGDAIVKKAQIVTATHLKAVRAMQEADYIRRIAIGICTFAILSLFTILFIQYLRIYQSKLFNDTRWLWFIANLFVLMLIMSFAAGKIFPDRPWVVFALPIPSYAILLTIFYRPRIALLTSAFLAACVALMFGSSFEALLVHLVCSLAAVFIVRRVRTTTEILKAGALLGPVSALMVLAVHAIQFDPEPVRTILISSAAALGSGMVIVPFLTFGIIPFVHNVFGLTSDFKLLELSDLNHPLLREMLIKTPGSYQHSLAVSILAEAAAESMDANSLLARRPSFVLSSIPSVCSNP